MKLRKDHPGRHLMGVMLWAARSVDGKRPRHRRAVLYLAARALEARLAAWCWWEEKRLQRP